jgi:2-methylcitrate dehydratase
MKDEGFRAEEIDRVRIDIFDVAHRIIGGGDEGDKTVVRSKEDADHSLPYIVAVAALDGEVTPAQYAPGRIAAEDVQRLLLRVDVYPDPSLSSRFPGELPCRPHRGAVDGRIVAKEISMRFHTRPMSRRAVEKFRSLAGSVRNRDRLGAVVRRYRAEASRHGVDGVPLLGP